MSMTIEVNHEPVVAGFEPLLPRATELGSSALWLLPGQHAFSPEDASVLRAGFDGLRLIVWAVWDGEPAGADRVRAYKRVFGGPKSPLGGAVVTKTTLALARSSDHEEDAQAAFADVAWVRDGTEAELARLLHPSMARRISLGLLPDDDAIARRWADVLLGRLWYHRVAAGDRRLRPRESMELWAMTTTECVLMTAELGGLHPVPFADHTTKLGFVCFGQAGQLAHWEDRLRQAGAKPNPDMTFRALWARGLHPLS
jgi:hypothetical protein